MSNFLGKSLNGIRKLMFICAVFVLVSAGIMICLGLKPAVIISGSMEPTIKTGSLVIIDTGYDKAVKRDIVVYSSGSIYVTHRVVEVTDEGYVTKGDANKQMDPGILKKEDLVGRVVMWVPYVGYAIKFMTSLPVIIICIMLMVVTALIQVAEGKERADEKNKNTESSCSSAS